MKINHNLIHFHQGFVSQEGLDEVTMELDKVRKKIRKENGLPKYVAFDRAFDRTNQTLVDNLKGKVIGAGLAIGRQLFHLRRKMYNNTTPLQNLETPILSPAG